MSDELDPRDERIADYLRSRSAVSVPPNLLAGAMQRLPAQSDGRPWFRPPRLFAGLAAALVVVLVAVTVFVNLPRPPVAVSSASSSPATSMSTSPQASGASPTPTASSVPTPTLEITGSASPTGPPPMPTTIMGMPVMTVAQASQLLDSGQLNGRAVAVSGYFEMNPANSCFGPAYWLQVRPCIYEAFTDAQSDAMLCHFQPNGDGTCKGPPLSDAPYLVPLFLEGADYAPLRDLRQSFPVRAVIIGHAGDPRLWGCPPGKEAECRQVFVADRVAWVNGRDVPVTAIGTDFYPPLPPVRMTLDEVAAGLGLSGDLVSAIAVDAGSVAQIDPRWNFTGNTVVWVLRSLRAATDSGTTRGETLWLVDDSTGQLIGSHDIAAAADYNPARLWISAVEHCNGSCRGDEPIPAFELRLGGAVLSSGWAGGDRVSGTEITTSEPVLAAVLDPGHYSVTAWLANPDQYGNPAEPRMDQCSASVTLDAGHSLLSVDFPAGETCTFGVLEPYAGPAN